MEIEAEIWLLQMREAAANIEKADIMILGPQVRFLENKMKGIAGDKPVTVIDMVAYGSMNGERFWIRLLKSLGK